MRQGRQTEEGARNSINFSEGYDSGHFDREEGTSKLEEGIPRVKTVLKRETIRDSKGIAEHLIVMSRNY